jgi:hypothetical protein
MSRIIKFTVGSNNNYFSQAATNFTVHNLALKNRASQLVGKVGEGERGWRVAGT